MKTIRVLIVDDSSLARGLLRDFLEGEDGIEVAGEATNGREALELTQRLRPDIVTMDLEMPVMNGMDAIEEIMCSKAVPILVVSSVADAHNALEAVGRGALEVVGKPDCSPEGAADFVAKVRLLAGVSVITRLRPRKIGDSAAPAPLLAHASVTAAVSTVAPTTFTVASALTFPLGTFGMAARHIFAIASSTGGPQALAQILPALPADFPCPVVIAQHISDGFAGGMVEWLDGLCQLPVRLAMEGDLLQPGVVHISPSERNFSVTPGRRIALLERGPLHIYHPSCDVLLDSVADVYGRDAVGIILTGMGSDGAKGIERIRACGGTTIGQDEATSVIYGMNRVAIEAGGVQQVLPVGAIAGEMLRLAEYRQPAPGMAA
jgi:two-component system chemotaxis response regulator CheB